MPATDTEPISSGVNKSCGTVLSERVERFARVRCKKDKDSGIIQ